MMTPRPPLAAAFVVALAVACSQPPAQPTFGPEDEVAIRSTMDVALAIANGSKDWDAYVEAYYAPNATVLPPNTEALHGHAAMSAFLASFPPIATFVGEIVSLEGEGDLAYVYGTYHMEMSTPEGPTSDDGKYIEVWRRQADGGWRIIYDIFNSNLPAM